MAPSPSSLVFSLRWPLLGLLSLGIGVAMGQMIQRGRAYGVVGDEATAAADNESLARSNGRSVLNRDGRDGDVSRERSSAGVDIGRSLGSSLNGVEKLSAEQLMNAISDLKAEKSQFRRFMGVYEAVSHLGKDDVEQALRRAMAEKDDVAVTALQRRWAEVDPVGAANIWLQGTEKLVGSSFFSTWAKMNPTAAMRWLSELEKTPRRDEARTAIFYSVARNDPQRALEMAAQFPEGADRALLVTRAIHYMTNEDPGRALAAAKGQADPAVRSAGLDVVVSRLASTNLEEAIRVASELPPNSLSASAGLIASGLVRQSPQKALEWVQKMPEGPSRDAVYAGIAKEWAAKDVEAAAAWLDKLPQGSARNSAVLSFAGRSALSDPEGAALWLSTIPASENRAKLLTAAVTNWQRLNPKAAQQWLQSAQNLSPAERAALSTVLKPATKSAVAPKSP